ncbi:hypothetical protein DRQ09_00760, partial [candidate division KSB1 bacterium]
MFFKRKNISYLSFLILITIPSILFAQRWTTKTSMPTNRRDLTVNSVDGKLYAIGGFTDKYQFTRNVEEYNPETDSWSSKSSMPDEYFTVKSVVINSRIYVVGRRNSLIWVIEYDPATDTWNTKSGTTSDRSDYCVAELNNRIYIFGGWGNNQYLFTVEEYDLSTDSWAVVSSMPTERAGASAVAYNGKIYIIGGVNSSGVLNTFEVYDPSSNNWITKTSMPTRRRNLEVQVVEDKLFAIGGYKDGYESVVEEYNLITETWSQAEPMPTARESFGSCVIDNKIYAIGGANTSILSVNEEFSPAIPFTPDGLTAVAGNKIVNLKWNQNNEDDILQYNIYRSLIDGFSPSPSDSIGRTLYPDTTFTDNNVQNNTIYYYRISAVDTNNNMSEFSSQVSAFPQDTVAPSVPQNLVALPDNKKVTLKWSINPETDLKQYNIYRNLSSGFTPTSSDSVGSVLKPDTIFVDSNLVNNITYYYRISAVDSSGNESEFSEEVSATPADTIPPSPPQNLTATGLNESIRLVWNSSPESDLLHYKIYRNQTDGFTPAPSDSIGYVLKPDTVFTDSSVIVGQIYYYRVSAVDSSGNESGFSNQAEGVPIDTVPPAVPENFTVNSGERYLDLSWKSNSEDDMLHYIIYRSLTDGFTPTSSDSLTLVSYPDSVFRDSSVTVGTTYYYRICAVDTAFNRSEYSAQASGTPFDTTAPDIPVNLTAVPGQKYISVSWNPNTENDLLKYIIYRSINEGFSPSTSDSLTEVFSPDTAYLDSAITVNTTYYYKISAVDSFNNESEFSGEVSATPFDTIAPSTPLNLTAVSGNKQVELKWNKNPENDLLQYVIFRSLTDGFTPASEDSIDVVSYTDTIYTDNSVFNNQTYYYRISAVDSAWNYSGFSNQVSATPSPEIDYSWQTKSPMNYERRGSISGAINGKIYTVGGRDASGRTSYVEEYDPETNSWSTKTPLPSDREDFGGDVLNGKLYIVGGRKGNTRYTTVEAYDPSTDSWETITPMDRSRRDLAVVTCNGKLYAISGRRGGTQYQNHVEEYDPATSTWTYKASIPTPRWGHAAASVNGKIYVIGGYNGSYLSTVEEYDPASDQWNTKTSMPTARRNLTANTIAGRIYAIGGENGSGNLSIVEIYDPITDTWTTGDTMITIRREHSSAVLNDTKLYAIGGADDDTYLAVNEEFNPPPWQPQNFSIEGLAGQVRLTWSANIEPDLDYYIIYRSQTDGFTPSLDNIIGEASREDTFYIDNNVVPSETYYYIISAVDSAGQESQFSVQVSVTISNYALQLGITDTLVTNGDTLTIPLIFFGNLDNGGITSFQFKLAYDSTTLNGIGIDTTGFGNPLNILSNIVPGTLKVAAYCLDTLRGTDRTMNLIFSVKDEAMRDTTYIQFVEAYFNEGTPPLDLSSTTIRVKPRYGDVTGDKSVTSYDASWVLQYVVGQIEFSSSQKEKADVTYNGEVSAYDAYYILLKVTGIINTLPVEDSLFSKISFIKNPDISINTFKNMDRNNDELLLKISAEFVKSVSSFYIDINFNNESIEYRDLTLS